MTVSIRPAAQCCNEGCRAQARSLLRPQAPSRVVSGIISAGVLGCLLNVGVANAEAIAESATQAAAGVSAEYAFEPYLPEWQIWMGSAIGVFPFIVGASEFTKRILIQRRCPECRGTGLVERPARDGSGAMQLRKCPECGGMFPWQSWQRFLSATATPGNGGPLLQPRGQTSVLYKVPPPPGGEEAAAETTTEMVERLSKESEADLGGQSGDKKGV